MSALLLWVGKLTVLGLLYMFLWSVIRVIAADLRDPATAPNGRQATPRPATASAEPQRQPARHRPTQLVLHPVTGTPRTIALGDELIVFGRAARATHILDDDYASDEHAELAPTADGWQVRDLGSTNGTYLNGRKVVAPTALAGGDQLQLGKTRVEVRR